MPWYKKVTNVIIIRIFLGTVLLFDAISTFGDEDDTDFNDFLLPDLREDILLEFKIVYII